MKMIKLKLRNKKHKVKRKQGENRPCFLFSHSTKYDIKYIMLDN